MESWNFIEKFASLSIVALVIIGIANGMRMAHRRREMEHSERIKALEMGLVPQPSGLDWPAAWICIAIGAGVPIGSFVVTWLATLTTDAPGQIWFAPALVSFSAIGSARKLAYRIINPKSGSDRQTTPEGKPALDPDAYDVVGSRG